AVGSPAAAAGLLRAPPACRVWRLFLRFAAGALRGIAYDLFDYTRDLAKIAPLVQASGTAVVRGFRGLTEGFRGDSNCGVLTGGTAGFLEPATFARVPRKQSGCRSSYLNLCC